MTDAFPWTWERLRGVVTELNLPAGSYAVGPQGILLADGTQQAAPSMGILVSDSLFAELATQGWASDGHQLTSPLYPDLHLSTQVLGACFDAPPDEVIRRAVTIDGVQVPPRSLVNDAWETVFTGLAARYRADHASEGREPEAASGWAGYRPPAEPRRRKPGRRLAVAVAVVGLLVLAGINANMASDEWDHLTGSTVEVDAETVSAQETGEWCGSSDDSSRKREWTVDYAWTVDGRDRTATKPRCSDNQPRLGATTVWIDADGDLASTGSPGVTLAVIIALNVFGLVLIGGLVVITLRTFGRPRRSRPR